MFNIGWISPADFFGKMSEREEFLRMREMDALAEKLLPEIFGVSFPTKQESPAARPKTAVIDSAKVKENLGGKVLRGRDLGAKDALPSADMISSTSSFRPGG